MAKKVREFDWNNRVREGENALDQYLDGTIWELTTDDARELGMANYNNPDTYRTIDGLRTAMYNRAKKINKKFRYRKTGPEMMVVQAYEKEEVEDG